MRRIDGQEIVTKIKMMVIVENNSRGDVINLARRRDACPIINKRKAETQVSIKEGERLVIGGVTQNVQQTTVRKVPLLGDIPILGWLFKQTRRLRDRPRAGGLRDALDPDRDVPACRPQRSAEGSVRRGVPLPHRRRVPR